MKVLVIGGGGREHALAWKLAQSKQVSEVFVAPGNAGTALEAKVVNVNLDVMDFQGLCTFAEQQQVALTVVGPEAPLVAGITDYFHDQGLACFGPSAKAAQLEGSKAFCKDFFKRHAIPTADYATFTRLDEALDYLNKQSLPLVIKADGLAAGKGVVIAHTQAQAEHAVNDMLSGDAFGDAGQCIVIEEYLTGEEASFIVMVDGEHALSLASSQDHKARDDGDQGPNTGGMGAYSPAPVVDEVLKARIEQEVIYPTIEGLKADGCPYVGFLYAGLMIDANGNPKVLEFNCRFGDPETQVIMMRLQSDLYELCTDALAGILDTSQVHWDNRAALGVVMAAGGYPESYRKGDLISGIPGLNDTEAKVFHAGTRLADGPDDTEPLVYTQGGRVLCVCAMGHSVKNAQALAYEVVHHIHFDDCYYRKDIGYRAVAREDNNV